MNSNKFNLFCPECNGSKSLSFFLETEPHLFCHKCNYIEFNEDKIEEYFSTTNTKYNSFTKGKKQTMTEKTDNFPVEGSVAAIPHRGLNEDTCKLYKVETLFKLNPKTNLPAPIAFSFPFFNKEEAYVAQKIKYKNKKDTPPVIKGTWSATTLFGQHIFPAGCSRDIIITEGEEDAMAAHQMISNDKYYCPVVSIRNGAQSAKKDCQVHWEYLNSFQNIIICFDNDEPGKKASLEVADLFPNKAKVMRLEAYKDANEYLLANEEESFRRIKFGAEKILPQGILSAKEVWEEMNKTDSALTVPYPWKGLQDMLYGMRTGELVVWKAPPKCGKTQLFRALSYHIKTTSTYNVGLIFLEDTTKRIGMGMCSLQMAKNLQIPDTIYTLEELKQAHEELFGDDRFFIFDPRAERTAENVLNKITHFVKAYDVKFIFLDHVSMLAYDNLEGDERRFLDKLFKDLKDATVTLDVHISAITHVNDDGKARGSRASYQLCDALVSLERDKLNPDEVIANTLKLIVEENRVAGTCGEAVALFFNKDTSHFSELNIDDITMVEPEQAPQFKKVGLKFDD